jgi:hypothetical protein
MVSNLNLLPNQDSDNQIKNMHDPVKSKCLKILQSGWFAFCLQTGMDTLYSPFDFYKSLEKKS